MINFFRRIRKQFADDNKPLKYMRYAIGEILLVVIGILIALQTNNWNEEQKEYILYDDFKLRENSLSTTYSYEKFLWDYKTIQKAGNEKIIADFYCILLDDSIVEMKILINDIEVEIEN